ncbi:MAG: autotransporter-associated beta strand repeat-containing protein, partial [Verrucomicrobiales bacterium]|nr:autotransporter-associated beta strand repeat-containing protein [Verrucomicrobiales bacterium]
STTATALRTLTINPNAASVSALGSGTRTLTVDSLTGLTFGNNQSFSGGTLLKDGGGVLTLGGAASTFSKLQVEMGTVKGFLNGNTTLGGGPSVFGAGNISVSGGDTVLEITGTNNADTLTIGNNANINLSGYATFRLSGGGLALVGGTINLNGNGILDYGAGTVTLGNTAILGASAEGFNFGSNLIFTNNTGITNTGSFRYNLTNSGTQILSRDTTGAVTVSGTMIKTGAGNTVIDPSITSLTLTRGLQLDAGTLTFTAANQYPSALAFTGTAATVSLGGFNQSVGAVSVSGGAQGVFALGGDLATSTQLALGAVTLGNPASRLKIRDYTDGTLLVGTPDKVTISGGIALDQVWFHGYNKGATLTSGELKPANGLLNSRFIGGSNIEWHNPVNWLNTYSADADAYNIPNSPGAIAYISQDGGSLYNKTITTGTGITLGELRIASASNTYINGTITFDSGKPGVAAIFNGGGMQFYLSSATVRLKSDLTISNMQVWSSIGNIHDDYETSGIGRKVIFASGLVTELYGPASSFRGGLEMNNGVQIGLMNNNSTVTYSNGTWLGLGPVTINGSVVLYGRHLDARQYNALFRLTNQFILNGNLTTGGVYYDYAGDVNLTATRTINSAIATQVTNYAKTDSTIFGKDWNFTGVGGLTFSGAQFKRLLGANHTFTGGLSNINGTLWGDATYADGHEVVLGSLAAGKNPLGPGTVSVNPTSTTVANILVVNAVKTTLASGTINLGTTTYGTFGVLDGDTYLTGGAVIGSGWFRTDGDLYFGSSATVANANFSFMGDSLTKKIRAVAPGAVTIRNVLKDGAGTATIDASITKLTAGTVTVSGGMLALGANNQLDATTLALNGGMFSADGFRNSGIVTLNLLADSALQLGTGGGLQFSTVGTGANWLSSALLTIQNNGGAWAAGDTGSYVRFSSDITSLLTAPLLGNIGFTGYESGAKIQQAGGYYYLLPDAVATNEWSGDAADHVKWGVAGNWLNNSVPAGSGVSVSFRDLDASLGGKTVDVDGAYTLGRLSLQATPGFTLGGSGTLIFNNGADRAAVNSSGGGQTVTAAWRLDSDLDLNLAISRAGGQLALANTISGAGDMYLNGGNTALNLGGNNAAWSGNLYWNDSTQRLRVTTTGTAPLTGSGTFFIGGTGAVTNDYYYIEPYGAARTVRLAGGAVLNANLALAQNSDGVTDNGNFYNLTLTGGTLELSGTGQRIITVASLGEQVRPVLSIYNVISGSAGLTKAGGGSLVLYGNNTFTGDFNWTDGMVYAYADNALGLGTVRFNLSSDSKYMYALSDGARFSNQIVSAGNRTVGAGGLFYWNANSSVVGSSTINGFLSITGGTHIFGKEHVITGNGYMTRAALWMLGGDNTFTGNNSFTYGSYYVIGASSTKDENGVVTKGPLGVGTLTTGGNIGSAGLYVYSDTETEQRLGNTIVFGGDVLVGISFRGAAGALPAIVNGTATPNKATTLVLDANTLTLRPNHASVIRPDGATLRIESQIKDAVGGTLNSVAKEGAGVLVLTNAANEISGGIDARLGTVRLVATGNSNVQIGGGGASPLGTGQLRTQTATGAGNAGAFEIVAADSGTVTLLGTDRIVLNNNGQFRVTGSNVTTVLANNGALISTGAVGQEGSLVADLVKTTNYTLTAKIAARNWQLDAGTVNLARANLTNSAGTITFTAGSVLNVNHHVQTLPNIVVDGNATINVSGGVPSNPVTLTVGSVTVNSGTLMFSGWAGDIPTGKGSTIVQSTLNVGTVVHDVSLASGVGQAIVRRNIDGVSVLMPYDLIFTWDGAANNNLWTENDWIKNGQHTASEQPDGITATAIFDTDTASLANQTISLNGERKVGTLQFTGATKTGYTISGAGNAILLDSGVSGADTFIKNDGASDVTLNTDLRLVYYAPDGENLNIEQNGAGHLFFNGQISGPDSVVSVEGAGAGAVIFSGNNTFSRGFILNSGNVWLGADSVAGNGPLGGGLVTLRGGTLRGVTSGGTTGANRTLTNDYNLDGGFVLAGANTLTLAGDGAISQNSTVNTGNGSVILGATGKTLTVSGSKQLTTVGAVTVNGGVALGGALETNISDTTTMNATVSGAGQLTKTGAGTLLLTGSNTSTGGFALAAGVTGVNNSAALGTGTATLGGGTLRLNANNLNLANNVSAGGGVIDTQANTGTLSGKIAGSGGFTKTGSGALTVTQSNSYTGTTNISAGAVISSQADALGASAVVVSSSLTLAFNNATYDNATSGAGNITVSGTGVRVDSVANTTTGTWNIAGSALINDANNLGPNGKVNLSGTLTTDGNNNLTFTNTLTGAGVINFTGSGTHGLAGTGTNFTGTARANGGVFDWSATTSAALTKATLETVSGKLSVGSGTQSAAKLIMNGGTTQFTGTARVTNYTISATSSVLFDLADLSSRSLLQQDEPVNNTLIISTNNWTGSLNDLRLVTAGGTVLGVTSTLPVGTGTEALGVYSNTLGKTGNNLTLAYALQELKLQPNKTLTLTGDTTATGGAELHALISGAGNLTIAANNAITLNTKETFTGTLTVTTGTLVAGVADVVASSTRLIVNSALALNNYNQTVNNLSGATAGRVLLGSNTLTVNTTLSSTYAGVITGAGALVKTGADTLTLSGSSTYSGPTNLTSGTLRATNASALGSGTAAVAATLVTEFTGTLSNNLTGSGTVRAVSGANVTLAGNNASLTGLLDILAGGKVTARAATNIGTARLTVGGTFIADNNAAWTLTNTLSGAGVLLKQNTANLIITQANTAFTGTASIVGGTLTLGHLQGIGSAAITDNAVLQLSNLSGTLTNKISGAGNVDVNASAVTLSGSNTLSGTFQVAAGSTLKAVNQYSLGSGKVSNSGTLTLGGINNYQLSIENLINGTGQLVKEDANTVTVSHSNSYTGGSVIRGGELNLANLNGLGSGNVANSAALRLSANNGSFANNVSGSGTVHVSGSGINLTGTNTVAAWRVTGSGTVSGT